MRRAARSARATAGSKRVRAFSGDSWPHWLRFRSGRNTAFDDTRAIGARKNQMLDIVAAQENEFLTRPDREGLDDLETPLALRFDKARHSEAAHGEACGTNECEHQKQR